MSKVKDKLEKTVVMGARSLSSPIRQNPFERYRLNSDKQLQEFKNLIVYLLENRRQNEKGNFFVGALCKPIWENEIFQILIEKFWEPMICETIYGKILYSFDNGMHCLLVENDPRDGSHLYMHCK
ncbi:MAG: hypothetical protein AAB396_01020 [Patescibacteria group bacterium]